MTTPNARTYLPHLKLSWGGTLGNPAAEIWSNTVNFAPDLTTPGGDEAPSAAELQAIADAVAPALIAWFTHANTLISNAASLTTVKATWILNNGKQRDVNTAQHEFPANTAGASNNGQLWIQSFAITLRSPLNRGRGHAGRVYPVACGAFLGAGSPYISVAAATGMSERFTTLLAALLGSIAAALNPGGGTRALYPAIVSVGNSDTGVPALINFINRVVVDRVPDIQHRRTNRVPRAEAPAVELYAGGVGQPGLGV